MRLCIVEIDEKEVRPGLVMHVDPAVLVRLGGATTNAELSGTTDRAVQGEHEFLVLLVDDVDRQALAVPLFSEAGPDRQALDDSLKGGDTRGWIGPKNKHHFSRWQHWWVPLGSIPAATTGEWTAPRTRHTYAEHQPGVLEAIADTRKANRSGFRGV
jgi:hypothetical protein